MFNQLLYFVILIFVSGSVRLSYFIIVVYWNMGNSDDVFINTATIYSIYSESLYKFYLNERT